MSESNIHSVSNEAVDAGIAELDDMPAVASPKLVEVKSREERAQDWMARTDTAAIEGAAGLHRTIAGHKMLDFSMARASFLRRLDNPFISGVSFSDIADPFMSVGEFILICSSSLEEGRKLLADRSYCEAKVLELLDKISAPDISDVMDEIVAYTKSELGSRVHGEPKEESTSSEPGN